MIEKIKDTIELFLACGILVGIILLVSKVRNYEPPVLPEPTHTETIVHDTVTDIQWKTRYITKTDTAYLKSVDTIYLTDSVLVEVPIYVNKYDTILSDSTHLKATVSGYNVTLDSIEVERKIITDSVPYEVKRFHWGWGIALGFGYVR